MSNPKRFPQDFVPNHIDTQPRDVDSNNGKKMANKTNDHADYVPPKGK
ncbi:acid-soluble spore protein N [Fictibacillus nanhaiensis]|nr:acid-soluble spore protein N [Fictibacillus nanhaiensis]MCM3730141.1 acid-soluble spore protein N [Fictibacillus nanhaiensis]